MAIHKWLLTGALALGAPGCSGGGKDADDTGSAAGGDDTDAGDDTAPFGPSFELDVLPLLLTPCGSCHAEEAGITPYRGPGDFASADADVAYASAMEHVTAGDPDSSSLYLRLTTDVADDIMPPPPGTSDAALNEAVRAWIAGGALP